MNGQKLSLEKRLDISIKIVFRQSTYGRNAAESHSARQLSPLYRALLKALPNATRRGFLFALYSLADNPSRGASPRSDEATHISRIWLTSGESPH